jgi:hypothetical protein
MGCINRKKVINAGSYTAKFPSMTFVVCISFLGRGNRRSVESILGSSGHSTIEIDCDHIHKDEYSINVPGTYTSYSSWVTQMYTHTQSSGDIWYQSGSATGTVTATFSATVSGQSGAPFYFRPSMALASSFLTVAMPDGGGLTVTDPTGAVLYANGSFGTDGQDHSVTVSETFDTPDRFFIGYESDLVTGISGTISGAISAAAQDSGFGFTFAVSSN